jgi:hypothetical protein
MTSQHALLHLAWRRDNDGRHLIFGWLEILPGAMPYLRGHPYIPHRVKGSEEVHVYVARFPMSADVAERWFEDASAGLIKLPVHPDKATGGDGSIFLAPPTIAEPAGDGESMAMELPFLPANHGAAYVKGLFPKHPGDPHFELQDEETAQWLADKLFFDLRDQDLYVGSLLHVRYGSKLRTVERHLAPRSDGDDEVVRLTTWPGADLTGAEIIAMERRPLGFSEAIRIPVTGPLVRINWPGKVDHTGLVIIHPDDGLCWWSDLLPFVRTIFLNLHVPSIQKQITVAGKTKDTYQVTEMRSPSESPIVIGDAPDPFSVTARNVSSKTARERRKISDALGVQWFDDPATAAAHIRKLLQNATQYVWIVDPYFAGEQVVRFALAVPRAIPVQIFTWAEHLRSRANGLEYCDVLDTVLRDVQHHVTVTAKVMVGQSAPVHDRFLLIDGRVWFSGNSLNAIGERASVLLEIPNPDEILRHLQPILRAAVPFEKWIVDRRDSRERRSPT